VEEKAMGLIEDLEDRFSGCAWVDDPFLGPVLPGVFAAESPVWPSGKRWAEVELLGTVTGHAAGRERVVSELYYQSVDPDAEVRVPVGVVWDHADEGPVARVYYNKKLVGGPDSERVRPPVIPPEPGLDLHPTMKAYHAALHAADAAGIAGALDPGFRVRGPDGRYLEGARTRFAELMAGAGGVPIMYVTATDDGTSAALEFISWRTPPHAGLGVYERSAAGLICDFRVYEGPVRFKPGSPSTAPPFAAPRA
jgi:hypothetical protein